MQRFLVKIPLLAAVAACLAGFPAPASAGQYEVVDACKNIGQALGVRAFSPFQPPGPSFGFTFLDFCQTQEGSINLFAEQSSRGGLELEIAAHPFTTIRGLEYERVLELPEGGSHRYSWVLLFRLPNGNENPLEVVLGTPGFTITSIAHHEPGLTAASISGRLVCQLEIGCAGPAPTSARAGMRNLVLTLEDGFLPSFTAIGGSLLAEEEVRGTHTLDFTAQDRGSGIARAFLSVDGVEQPAILDPNGGKCVEPYVFMVPCKLSLSSSLQLDTTRFSEGIHEVKVALVDASGNRRDSPSIAFVIHNAPTNTVEPELGGSPELGGRLTVTPGTWEGSPTAFSYRWLRCAETAERISECRLVDGATGSEYVLGPGDLRSRLLAQVTATNASGPESAFSDATLLIEEPLDETPPVLAGVSISRRAFRVGAGRTALTAAAKRARGTVLRFSSSEAGRLAIAIRPARKGGRVAAAFARTVGAGRGSFAFSGRVGRRPLPPGRYELLVALADTAGNRSNPARLTFRILPG